MGVAAHIQGPSEGASTRDELLARWAHVLFDQYGADAFRHVAERGQACALRGDRAGVAEWEDVGRIIGELARARRLAGDDIDIPPLRDYGFCEDAPPVAREWGFWVILVTLAAAILVMTLLLSHI